MSIFSEGRREEASEALGKAEMLNRQDRFKDALEELGTDEPSPALPALLRLRWYWLAGWALPVLGRGEEGEVLLKRGLDLAERLRSQLSPAQHRQLDEMKEWLRCFLGLAYCAQERTEAALVTHHECKRAIEQGSITDAELKMWIHKGLGNSALVLGWFVEAIGWYRAAIKEGENLLNWRQLGLAYWGLAMACQKNSDPIGARDAFQEALIIFERRESQELVAPLRALFGKLLTELGDYPEAEHQLALSLELATKRGEARAQAVALGNIAGLHLARHEYAPAIARTQQAVQIAQRHNDHRTEGQLHLILAAAYEAQQDRGAAEQEIQEAIRILAPTQDRDYIGRAYERSARFLAAQGAFQQAFEHMSLAYSVTLRTAQ